MLFRDTRIGRLLEDPDILPALTDFLAESPDRYPRPVENDFEAAFDREGDGGLSHDEYLIVCMQAGRALAAAWLSAPEEEANLLSIRSALDRGADIDGNGVLDTDERIAVSEALSEPHRVTSPFGERIDADGSGEINGAEIAQARDTGFIVLEENGISPSSTSLSFGAGKGEPGQSAAASGKSNGAVKRVSLAGERLAVLGVRDLTETMGKGETNLLISFLENAFVNYGDTVVVDRQNLEKIMAEYNYQVSALVDENTAVQIGKLSGAHAIAVGSISKLGEVFYLHLKLINVETGAILGSSISQGASKSDFLAMCNGAVEPLF
jgi:hypothetical protein